jgi:hypothetical protein
MSTNLFAPNTACDPWRQKNLNQHDSPHIPKTVALSLSGWALALQNSIVVLPVVWMVEWFMLVYSPVFFSIAPTMVAT